MKRSEIEEILNEKHPAIVGDGAFKGLMIIAEYYDESVDQIMWAGDDKVYSIDLLEIERVNMLESDLEALSRLGWGLEEGKLFINV